MNLICIHQLFHGNTDIRMYREESLRQTHTSVVFGSLAVPAQSDTAVAPSGSPSRLDRRASRHRTNFFAAFFYWYPSKTTRTIWTGLLLLAICARPEPGVQISFILNNWMLRDKTVVTNPLQLKRTSPPIDKRSQTPASIFCQQNDQVSNQ